MPAHADAAPRATTRTLTRTYPGTAQHARAVRADLRALLRDCPRADEIVLCASELAANAAIHSHSARPGGAFTVHADIRPGSHARIEITDDGGPWPEHGQRPGADADHPHGLDIVTALAARWGITGTDAGRTVWLTISWHHVMACLAGHDGLPAAPDRHGHAQPRTTVLSGDRLRQARRKLGISRETLAHDAGIGMTTLARLEQHPQSAVRVRTLNRLAATLGESPADLTTMRPGRPDLMGRSHLA